MSIKLKLILPFILGAIIVSIVINTIWLPKHKMKVIEKITFGETAYLSLLGEAVVPSVLSLDLANLHANLDQIVLKKKTSWEELSFIDADGFQLYPLEKTQFIEKSGYHWIEAPINSDGKNIGVFKVNVNINQLISGDVKDIKSLEYAIYIILMLFSIMSFFLQYIFISQPIQKTSVAVSEIAKGNYNYALPVSSKDEIGLFIDSFKKMVDSLKDREENLRKFNKAINDSGHSISITDHEGFLQYVNKSFVEETGYEENEVIGQNIVGFSPDGNKENGINDMWESLSKGGQWKKEMVNKRKNGEKYDVSLSVSPIFDEQDKIEGYVFVQIDITQQKKLTRQLEQQTKKAVDANKAKSEFIANMSHEIRTPLNAVIGFSEILMPEIDDEENKKCVEAIKTAGNNLLQLINDILDLSKIEAGMLSLSSDPVSISTMMRELECVYAQSAKSKGLNFIIELSPLLPENIICDEIRLRQSLSNLIGNAIKFTREGGIRLCVKESYVNNNSGLVNVEFKVKDTGIGIPEDQQDLIFESFRQQNGQSNRDYGGTGLGLSITKKFVEMMNGEIKLKSVKNRGSEFTIILKDLLILDSEKVTDMIPKTVFNDKIDFQQAKILIVDDAKLNRDLLKTFLLNMNTQVIEAVNGEEAVFLSQQSKPGIILMDIRMPVMDGYRAAELIKANQCTADIPIIATTASVHMTDINIKYSNFDYYIAKPIHLKNLVLVMTKFINSKIKIEEIKTNDDFIIGYDILINSELDYLLKNYLLSYWKEIKDSNDFEKIAEFSIKLQSETRKYECQLLNQYSESLQISIEKFDILKIGDLLTDFPKLIEGFKVA